MGDSTGIEWTDSTWNPVRGCSRVSEGCRHCYAEGVAARFSGPGQPYEGLADSKRSGSKWTGQVRLIESALEQPLRWQRPRRIFVNSMSDLFHEALPDAAIDRVFAVMQASPQHTFQVLTKRAERMVTYFAGGAECRVEEAGRQLAADRQWCHAHEDRTWPLSNIWLGVSVENQAAADERIPLLLATPAAVRFLSCEPLLGPVDLSAFIGGPYAALPGDVVAVGYNAGIGWVIAGGESGHGARPMHPEWARSLRDQCVAAGVPFFFKQHGEWVTRDHRLHGDEPAQPTIRLGEHGRDTRDLANVSGAGREVYLQRVGKKAAGDLLDGQRWQQFPELRHG